MLTNDLQRLNELQQKHRLTFRFTSPTRAGGSAHAPVWRIGLHVDIPHATPIDVQAVSTSKKNAKHVAATQLFRGYPHVADLVRQMIAPDVRPVVVLIDRTRGYLARHPQCTVYVGAQHAARLSTLDAAGGVVAVDTEGACGGLATWIQIFNGTDTVLLLPVHACYAALVTFLRSTNTTKLFWDYASDARQLPPVQRVVDVQHVYARWRARQMGVTMTQPMHNHSLANALSHVFTKGAQRVCKLPLGTNEDTFYSTFDTVGELDELHRTYMVGDVVYLWELHGRVCGATLGNV